MEIKVFELLDEELSLKKFLKRKDIIIKFISTRGGVTGTYCDVFYEKKKRIAEVQKR